LKLQKWRLKYSGGEKMSETVVAFIGAFLGVWIGYIIYLKLRGDSIQR
jgi:hypothetical protein